MSINPLMEIKFSDEFKNDLRNLAKKYRSIRKNLQPILDDLQAGNFKGDQIAHVGYTVFKLRLKNSDNKNGKSAGYRVVYYAKTSTSVILITFDLMDAVLTSPSVKSFAELSLSAVYRRKWSSLYKSLKDSRPRLRRLCVEQIPKDIRPLLAGDHTGWGRPHAKTLKDRSFVHQPNLVEGNKPIVLGLDYSTLGWVPEMSGSWAIPLCHERISSFETAAQRAAFQLRQVCRDLSVRPIATYDSEYGSANFVNLTADIPSDLLLRLRPNRCLYKAPEA